MKNIYLISAIVGVIVPCLFFIQFLTIEGINITLFISSLFSNGASGGFAADLLISSFVFWAFMFHQLRKPSNPKPYLFIVLNITIGLSCALPAYLYVREHQNSSTQTPLHYVTRDVVNAPPFMWALGKTQIGDYMNNDELKDLFDQRASTYGNQQEKLAPIGNEIKGQPT